MQLLSQEEAETLVSTTLNGPLDPDTAHRLWKLTRGNVLYLRNIVEQEVGDQRLTRQHDYWAWTGDPEVPPDLAEMIESRFGALSSAVADVVDTLAVGEPLDLASLNNITDPSAVEDADKLGIITLEDIGGTIEVRIAHPLYGEIRRKRVAPTRLRRLRGLVAAELAARADCDDLRLVVRRAALTLDSDLEPDPELLVRAAQGAVWLADLLLADRLADAAMRAGGSAEANFIRAHALSWLGRGKEADAVLAAIPTREFSVADRSRLAFLRASNMLWTLADPAGAKEFIDSVSESHDSIDAFLAVYWAAAGKPETTRAVSAHLDLKLLPDVVAAVTAWALAVACGDAGDADRAVAVADTGLAVTNRAFDSGHMRFVITDAHIGALLLAGRVTEATVAAQRLHKLSADLPGAAQVMSTALAGRAAVGAGNLPVACSLLQPAVELLLSSGDTTGWGYRYQLPLTIALTMLGAVDEAVTALESLERQRHPTWRYVDYEHALARGWVAAVQGVVSEGISIVLSAAETARANGQLAPEVMCLQTAAQFGDNSGALRLRELSVVVDGPRVGVAARFAEGLATRDAAGLESVSQDFERLGDLVAALDAAAHSAMAYRRGDRKGSALTCLSRAHELAARCGGADTPALRAAGEPVRFTGREREVVMLVGQGLSSRAIADRLMLSVRTVEGHIFRAMARTGAANRDELGRMLPRRETDT